MRHEGCDGDLAHGVQQLRDEGDQLMLLCLGVLLLVHQLRSPLPWLAWYLAAEAALLVVVTLAAAGVV